MDMRQVVYERRWLKLAQLGASRPDRLLPTPHNDDHRSSPTNKAGELILVVNLGRVQRSREIVWVLDASTFGWR